MVAKSLRAWFVPAAIAAVLALPADARRTTQTLAVSASVSPSAAFGIEFGSASMVITEKDLQRGYVDVTMKSRMRYTRASAAAAAQPPVMLDISGRPDLLQSVVVAAGSDAPPGAAANGNGNGNGNGHTSPKAIRPSQSAGAFEQTAEFRYRFLLSSATSAGVAAPISLIVEL